MFNYRQYMSPPQQMVSGPKATGTEARRIAKEQAKAEAANKTITSETARRQALG